MFTRLSKELGAHYAKFAGGRTVSDIAAVYSHQNSWAMPDWVVDGFYDEEFFNAYGGFKNALGRNVDVIAVSDRLEKYRVVVAPNLKIISEEQAARYAAWVENGGVLVLNTECGTRDEHNNILELLPPGLFADPAGAEAISNITAEQLARDERAPPEILYSDGTACGLSGTLHKLRVKSAGPIAFYTVGKLKGQPAVTLNPYGKGHVILYATDGNDVYFYEALADFIKTRFDIPPLLEAEDGVLVSSREKGGREFIFATNMKDSPAKLYPGRPYRDEISGRIISGEYTLEGYGTVVLTPQQA